VITTRSASVAHWASTLEPVVGLIRTQLFIKPIVIQLTLDEVAQLLDSSTSLAAPSTALSMKDHQAAQPKICL